MGFLSICMFTKFLLNFFISNAQKLFFHFFSDNFRLFISIIKIEYDKKKYKRIYLSYWSNQLSIKKRRKDSPKGNIEF